MPVIVVTGYPCTQTAIRSIELSVAAYLTKPVKLEELLGHVKPAIAHSRNRRALAAVRERVESCLADLTGVQSDPIARKGGRDELVSIGTIRTLAACLSELLHLRADSALDAGDHELCQLLDCPQQPACRQAIVDTIAVLKKTKDTFKSRDLAQLRSRLEQRFGM
jgi:CheY-like chemotaxis protein